MLRPLMRGVILLVTALCSSCSPAPDATSEGIERETTQPDSSNGQVDSTGTTEPVVQETEPLHLRWNLNDGDLFRWTYEGGMEMEGPQGDQVVKGTLRARMTFDVSVAAVEGDQFRMHYDLNELQVHSDAPGNEIDYDSTQVDRDADTELDIDLPEEELTARLFEALFGELLALEIETVTDTNGTIHDLSVGGDLSPFAQQEGLQSLLFLNDSDGLSSLHAGGFVRFPGEAFTPGDTWEQSTDVPARFGTVRFTHTATYSGPEVVDGVELLRFDTEISSTSVAKPALADVITMEDRGGSGVLYVNQESGHLATYSFRSDQNMTIRGAGFGGEDLEGAMTYFSQSSIERVTESAAGAVE